MPLYAFQAIDSKGKRQKGTVDAVSNQEAKEKLRAQGLMVSLIKESRGTKRKHDLKGDQLANFTLQLSQLIKGGIPLYESLVALEEQHRSDACHRVILSLTEEIKRGSSLSQAMGRFPGSFDKRYCAMIAAGESVGALDVVLERLNMMLKKQEAMKKKISTAMIYPAILGTFCLAILTLLLSFVVPSIEAVFEGRELNRFTLFVIGMSHFFNQWWWMILIVATGLIVYFSMLLRSPAGREWVERKGLKLPIVKNVVIQAAIARLSRTMGTLQEGGLSMIDSLRIARKVMKNCVLEEEMVRAERRIVEGSSLSHELSRSQYVPRIVSRMVAVGEESGEMGVMLSNVAEMYEGELDKNLERMMALMQPAILLIMGVVIGMILLAVLLPMADFNAFTQ